MKTLVLTILMVITVQALVFGQQEATTHDGKKVLLYANGTWLYADSVTLDTHVATAIDRLEIPKNKGKDKFIVHTGYSLLFNDKYKEASWVAYELTKEETTKIAERTNKFMVDPMVKGGTATDADYAASGYDKGHLAPAADMGWSSSTMAESFYYSNMSPQLPAFNRGVWKRLEELVRSWAIENTAVYIVTGPVLSNGLQTIGPDKVAVPNYFYKVVLDYTEPGIHGIGFIMANAGSGEPLQEFAVSIDSVEKLTGIDFFPLLPDVQENSIEKTLCIDCWSWKSVKPDSKPEGQKKSSASVQCNGNTKAGSRCSNKTLNASGLCYLHETQQLSKPADAAVQAKSDRKTSSVQCSGTTKAGNRCKHMTYSPNGSCYQHGGN